MIWPTMYMVSRYLKILNNVIIYLQCDNIYTNKLIKFYMDHEKVPQRSSIQFRFNVEVE
jgi:hypothetical protein